jgi:hypothetical protein
MACDKILNLAAAMNRMFVPHDNNRSGDTTEQVSEKDNHFLSAERCAIGLNVQSDLALVRTHTDGPNEIHTLIVFKTGANGRRLPAWGPGALERRDQRKPTFIRKNKGGTQRLPLFLYAAKHSVSNGQSPGHRDATRAVVVVGSSTAIAATDTKRRWGDNGRGTDPRSNARCEPSSSN